MEEEKEGGRKRMKGGREGEREEGEGGRRKEEEEGKEGGEAGCLISKIFKGLGI